MDAVHEELHVLDRRPGKNSVPEIEDVPPASRRLSEDPVDPIEKHVLRSEESERIEVALDRDVLSDLGPAPIENRCANRGR